MRERLSDTDITQRLASLDGWEREGNWIRRTYKFGSFAESMKFVNHVAQAAEQIDHHPDIDVRYDRVRLLTSTHSAGGITEMDFDLVRRIDDRPSR